MALLYSISSDLWQPFGYVHMLERRGTYLALVHDQYLVDMLTEEDIAAGRLDDYDVLYATDPCIADSRRRSEIVRLGASRRVPVRLVGRRQPQRVQRAGRRAGAGVRHRSRP